MHKVSFSKWQLAISALIILTVLLIQANVIKNSWMYAKGYEQEWVADSLMGGYGYSFDPATAWLGPYGDGSAYTPTAWVEPLYTLTIASAFTIFGNDYGRLTLILLNIFWLGASGAMIFLLLRDITNQNIGLYTTLVFLLVHACKPQIVLYLGNAALAGFLYCVVVYLLARYLKQPSSRRIIFLGIVIGLANLNHAGSLFLAPISAFIILLGIGTRAQTAWRDSLILISVTFAMLLPWFVRNYLVFDSFVPVRSGFGYQLYIGNPGLAETFSSGLDYDADGKNSPWAANNPLHALLLLRNLDYDAALASHSIEAVSRSEGADYQTSNEVERDRIFLSRGLNFMMEEPMLALQMSFWKALAFLTFWKIGFGLVSSAAIMGGLLFIKDLRVVSVLLLAIAYTAPYIVSLPLYYRYRSPIEPVLFVLAGLFLTIVLKLIDPVWFVFQKRFLSSTGRLNSQD